MPSSLQILSAPSRPCSTNSRTAASRRSSASRSIDTTSSSSSGATISQRTHEGNSLGLVDGLLRADPTTGDYREHRRDHQRHEPGDRKPHDEGADRDRLHQYSTTLFPAQHSLLADIVSLASDAPTTTRSAAPSGGGGVGGNDPVDVAPSSLSSSCRCRRRRCRRCRRRRCRVVVAVVVASSLSLSSSSPSSSLSSSVSSLSSSRSSSTLPPGPELSSSRSSSAPPSRRSLCTRGSPTCSASSHGPLASSVPAVATPGTVRPGTARSAAVPRSRDPGGRAARTPHTAPRAPANCSRRGLRAERHGHHDGALARHDDHETLRIVRMLGLVAVPRTSPGTPLSSGLPSDRARRQVRSAQAEAWSCRR